MEAPAAKSLILDLLSTLRPGAAMPVGLLVEAGELFGLSANNVRVSAARLLAEGHIARDERGSYRLGEKAQPVGQRVRSWRDLDRRTRVWGGEWIGVLPGKASRTAAKQRLRSLHLTGFRIFREALWIRPDNLAVSVDDLRAELGLLGLPAVDLLFAVRDFAPADEQRARACWDVAALRASSRELTAEIAAATRRLPALPAEAAMVESFLLGGRALRQLVQDPLLPDEICPSGERDALLAAMKEYDRLGRLAWAELLKRWSVPYLRAPLNGRSEVERPRLAI
jgi:phenylacetic acid degradation operon negative regulatory protein